MMLLTYWVAVHCIICEHLSGILWRTVSISSINKQLHIYCLTQHCVISHSAKYFGLHELHQAFLVTLKNGISIISLYIYFVLLITQRKLELYFSWWSLVSRFTFRKTVFFFSFNLYEQLPHLEILFFSAVIKHNHFHTVTAWHDCRSQCMMYLCLKVRYRTHTKFWMDTSMEEIA
jgi:hypothetical protein